MGLKRFVLYVIARISRHRNQKWTAKAGFQVLHPDSRITAAVFGERCLLNLLAGLEDQ